MEYVPLRTPAAEPYHYHHVTDQTKSLQELQNEVGALLEFRDLVIETFPDLKSKMASSAANSTLTGISSSSSSLAIRGKKEPKSGEGNNGSVIQDSGFSTETSSSKETHSAASSTSGAVQGGLILSTTINRLAVETEDELWNLLDVIHRKGSRLREEVDLHLEREKSRATNLAINHPPPHHHHAHHHHPPHPHQQQQHVASAVVPPPPTSSDAVATDAARSTNTTTTTVIVASGAGPTVATSAATAKSFQSQLLHTTDPGAGAAVGGGGQQPPVDHNVQILRNERDRLLDKLSAYEAETFAGRIREAKMHDELETLTLTMRDLQEQLKQSPAHALRAPSRYQLLQGNGKSSSAATTPPPLPPLDDPALVEGGENPKAPVGGAGGGLGRLDALLGSPPRLQKVRTLDSKKIAAILLETNIVELQRHLLTVTVQNQILQQRLEQATRSRLFLSEKFEKSKEDLDDLRFQLMEKSIELEGTKAQLRVIESKSTSGGKSAPPSAETSPEHHAAVGRGATAQQQHHNAGHLMQHHQLHHHHQHHHHHHQHHPTVVSSVTVNSQLAMRLPSSQVSTPSMKAMTPGSAAPKPPSGRNFSATPTPTTPTGPSQRPLGGGGGGSSGPSSNRSLTKSTGSLYVRSKSRSSSIPISSSTSSSAPKLPQPAPVSPPHRATPTMMTLPPPPIPPTAYGGVISSSPLPRPKRDTLTTKVKNCDSLSRKQSLRKDAPGTSATSIGSGGGQSSTSAVPHPAPAIRERKPSAGGGVLRHASSSSLGSADTPSSTTNVSSATNNTTTTTTTTPSDNGKVRNSRSSFWNWLKI
ncbi:hypothetical protein ZHAS_00017058 [Anopheles sinensis]|uniref:Uncharacterized protein n=1 Tax=Anopheles sinensis TaxID=74873 RepID=A0A084WFQ2_ANOSI|nr:hypothetical protein ZHAS_00017058 [Anopheles sinensis]